MKRILIPLIILASCQTADKTDNSQTILKKVKTEATIEETSPIEEQMIKTELLKLVLTKNISQTVDTFASRIQGSVTPFNKEIRSNLTLKLVERKKNNSNDINKCYKMEFNDIGEIIDKWVKVSIYDVIAIYQGVDTLKLSSNFTAGNTTNIKITITK